MPWTFYPDRDQDVPQPLDILIIGAGIGGLAAATGLRDQGHNVTLFEQSRLAVESGAAIMLPPNANCLLRRHGLDVEQDFGGMALHSDSGQLISNIDYAPDEFAHPLVLLHRSSLHASLKKLATDPTRTGPPAEIKTRHRIASVDPEKATVTLENGEVVQGDVVIGADGVNSVARQFLHGPHEQGQKPFEVGKDCFRWLVPRKKLQNDPRTKDLFSINSKLFMFLAKKCRVVTYPCEHNRDINIVAIYPSELSKQGERDDWNTQGDKAQIAHVLQDFAPVVRGLVDNADPQGVKTYRLYDMARLPTWVNGRMALLGDAAHPFLPYQGQGGAQAIEDGFSLAAMLSAGVAPKEVPARLELYERARKARAERIQQTTRIHGQDVDSPTHGSMAAPDCEHHLPGAPNRERLNADQSADAEEARYNYEYDEWENSQRILREWLESQKPKL